MKIHNYSVPLDEGDMDALIKRFGLENKRNHKEALTRAVQFALEYEEGKDAEQQKDN